MARCPSGHADNHGPERQAAAMTRQWPVEHVQKGPPRVSPQIDFKILKSLLLSIYLGVVYNTGSLICFLTESSTTHICLTPRWEGSPNGPTTLRCRLLINKPPIWIVRYLHVFG